ncbi:MAG TPA: hypothetical protein PKM50_09630 [Methanoregula sp.]|nr:hypothetical protein [Methanoregula sp.]
MFIIGGNAESSAQKAIFEILANNIRDGSRPHPAPEKFACNPDHPFGIPTHPASATCKECTAQKCCVLWECPLRTEIWQAAARKAREDVLNKLTVAVSDMGFPIEGKTNEFDDGRACAYGYFMREISKLRGKSCASCRCLVSDEDVKMEEELRDFPNEGDGY